MFQTLDQLVERAEGRVPSLKDRLLRYLTILLLSVLVFAALWLGLVLLE